MKFPTLFLVTLASTAFIGACMTVQPTPTNSNLRVVHASPDAPPVDVCANGEVAFAGAAFPAATTYATVSAGDYAIRVVGAGAGCDTAGVIDANLTLQADTDTTVVALNVLDQIEPLVLADDNSAPQPGNAKVRFVHAGPNAPTVDITLDDGTTLFDNVAFKDDAGYIEVPAGTYNLEVRDETGQTTVLALDPITLADGSVSTVFAIGLLNDEPALDVLITADN